MGAGDEMYKLSNIINGDWPRAKKGYGWWIPARPINEDHRTLRQRIRDSWAVFTGKASAVTWD